jgi:ABC-2 type transport system permease protein
VPFFIAFGEIPAVEGWTSAEVLLVVGYFTALKGFFGAMFFPSLLELATRIREGTLDFLLTKPAGALFLVSTSRFEMWRLLECAGGLGLMIWAFAALGRWPAPGGVALGAVLIVASAAALYSLCVLVGAAAFFALRLENLPYVFSSVLDFGRWPVQIFTGAARLIFTFVIPLGLVTTYPVAAVLGRVSLPTAGAALAGAAALFGLAYLAFSRALGRYTSASS